MSVGRKWKDPYSLRNPLCKKAPVIRPKLRLTDRPHHSQRRHGASFFAPYLYIFPFFLVLAACGGGSTDPTPGPNTGAPHAAVSAIELSPKTIHLSVGENQPVAVAVLDPSGLPIKGVKVAYEVEHPEIAVVTPDGTIEAHQEGTTLITASYEGVKSNPVLVRVAPPAIERPAAETITLSEQAVSIPVKASVAFAATAKDAEGNRIEGVVFNWLSSEPAVASINASGLAVGQQEGSTEITAQAEGIISPPAVLTITKQDTANAAPAARFTATPTTGNAPLAVAFDARASADPDGTIVSYLWDFGDGSTGNGAVVNHTYTQGRSFTAELSVVDNQNGTATARATITVESSPPPPPPPPSGNGWQKIGVNGDLFGVHFVSALEGWAVGLDQVIAHTTDGGGTWTLVGRDRFVWKAGQPPAGNVPNFFDVYFVNASTGWAVGWPEAIFKTSDGGATWVEQHLNAARLTPDEGAGVYLRKVRFLNESHGWTVGRFGYIFKTDDGGAAWIPISQKYRRPLPQPCIYPNAEHISPELRGTSRNADFDYNPHLFALDIIAKDNIWVGGGSEGDEPCSKGWLRVIMHSTDGGQTWDYLYESETADPPGSDPRAQLDGNGRIFDLKFIGNTAWAVGGNGTSRPNALYSQDGGLTWRQNLIAANRNLGAAYYGLAFLSPSKIWMSGWEGLIMHGALQADGSFAWSNQSLKSNDATKPPPQLRRIFFLDENRGWIASQGQVVRTVTGGK